MKDIFELNPKMQRVWDVVTSTFDKFITSAEIANPVDFFDAIKHQNFDSEETFYAGCFFSYLVHVAKCVSAPELVLTELDEFNKGSDNKAVTVNQIAPHAFIVNLDAEHADFIGKIMTQEEFLEMSPEQSHIEEVDSDTDEIMYV